VEVTGMTWDKDHSCWGWELATPRRFRVPVPCTGQLGLWKVPDDLAEEVRRQLG
jgi:hypothetical protein